MIEPTRDSHEDHLEEEEAAEDACDCVALVVNSADADEMHPGANGDEDSGHDRLEKVEALAHGGGPVSVEKGYR